MPEDPNRDRKERGYAVASYRVERPVPPPPGFTSPFRTVEEWLTYICKNNHTDKSISEYQFDLSEAPRDNLLSVAGYNHTVEQGIPTTRADFMPGEHMFFALPNDKYEFPQTQQLKDRVLKELKQFLNTDTFKNSFLSKAYTITTNFAGDIWSK